MKAFVALLFACIGNAGAVVDLTPVPGFYDMEGVRMKNLHFHEGSQTISYTPPDRWRAQGSSTVLTLTPQDAVQASAVIESVPQQQTLAPEEANLKAYSEAALKLVPPGALKAEVLTAAMSSLRISGRSLVEVMIGYSFFGQPYKMSVRCLVREGELLRFALFARLSDFPRLEEEFRGSLYSIQGL